MKYPNLLCAATLAAATLGAGSVLAQTAPSATTPAPTLGTPVVSDVAPPPPEDRSSPGAIVLHDSPVRAQRGAMSAERVMGGPPSFHSITRRAERAVRRHQTEQELEQMRMNQPRGSAGPTPD